MIFRYEVEYWDEIEEKESSEKGIACGETYGKVTDSIVDYYGKDNIFSVKVFELDNCICDEEIQNLLNT